MSRKEHGACTCARRRAQTYHEKQTYIVFLLPTVGNAAHTMCCSSPHPCVHAMLNLLPAMQTIQAVLKRYMDSPASDLPRIITSGHSLGGALAILAAVFIAHALPGYRQDSADYTLRKLQTYTFAAPRIGDVELAEYLSSTLKYAAVQVKNKPDVVPYAPPAGEGVTRGCEVAPRQGWGSGSSGHNRCVLHEASCYSVSRAQRVCNTLYVSKLATSKSY